MDYTQKNIITYRPRLYPTISQECRMLDIKETCRTLYNRFILESRIAYKEGYKIGLSELQSLIPLLTAGKRVYSKVAQIVVHHFFNNLSVLKSLRLRGKKVGRLRFKSKRAFKSFTYNQSGFKFLEGFLKLSKIGKIKMSSYQKIKGVIKEIHIKQESSGRWFANIVCQTIESVRTLDMNKLMLKLAGSVGIDVGLTKFSHDSDGHVVEHPKTLKKSMKRLKRLQRSLSRREDGSNNREKQRVKVVRQHERTANQRKDFLHKESRKVVDKYDIIFAEDLDINGMVEDSFCERRQGIYDSSWNIYLNFVSYKAERAGKIFLKGPAQNTSQRCSGCGKIVEKTLAVRTHRCPFCKLELDRDYNASINIKKQGISILLEELQKVTLGEIMPLENSEGILQAWSQSLLGKNQEAHTSSEVPFRGG
jgi:putative transposase